MSRLNDSSGGYLGARPNQTTSSCPGSFGTSALNERRRKGRLPAGRSGSASSNASGIAGGLASTFTVTLSESNCLGNGGTVYLEAQDTTVGVMTSGGTTYITVENAAPASSSGGTGTASRRVLYKYNNGGNYNTAYSGSSWPYVYVRGQLQVHGNISATVGVEAVTGRLLIGGNPVYQYTGDTDTSANGISSTWPCIASNGSTHTTAVSGTPTHVMPASTLRSGYSWSLTNGTTSGTNWSISGATLTLTLPAANGTTAGNYWQTLRLPDQALKTNDGFPLTGFTNELLVAAYGASSANPAGSAKALLNSGITTSGNYWIKNVNGSSARELYCDMSTDGGGWTRFANQDIGTQSNTYGFQYSVSDYNLTSFNTDTSHYVAYTHSANRRQYSSGSYLEYLFEVKNGTYKFKMNSFYEGDPGVGNRGAANITGISSSHFDFGWFNNNTNGYWRGVNGNTSSSCSSSTNIVHFVSGNEGYNGGYFSISRGYHADPGTSAGCGDHCGNIRRYWQIFPYIGHTQHCYSGYYSLSGFDGGGRISVSYRERGTLPAGGY